MQKIHITRLTPAAILLAFLTVTATTEAEPFLYVASDAGTKLVKIDVGAGTVTVIGPFGAAAPGSFAIAISPQGDMFTYTPGWPPPVPLLGHLAAVNPANGHATLFAHSVPEVFMGLGFAPDGALYGINTGSGSPDQGSLFQFNPDTGEATKVGVTGGCLNIMDIAFHPNGTMYGSVNDSLYKINRQTGQAELVTKIHGLAANRVMGLAIDDDGNFYVTETIANAPLLRVDPVSGAATLVLNAGLSAPHGMEFIPTPRNRPVTIAFEKSLGAGGWAGSIDTNLDGIPDGDLAYEQPEPARWAGKTAHFTGKYTLTSALFESEITLDVMRNTQNASIRGNGVVLSGWLDGAQVHMTADFFINDDGLPAVSGVMRLMPGTAD